MKQKLRDLNGKCSFLHNSHFSNNSWRPQDPSHNNGWHNQTENNEEIEDFNNRSNQLDLADIDRGPYPTKEYTFSSSALETSSRIDHMLNHKLIVINL